ncbi:MAG TPA: anaerobic sulfatase maturase [Candidatus Acidoferrales bacterium]|nr:anaerobic sulfatase maturase [Candidatus Acidoferrales bacterium]
MTAGTVGVRFHSDRVPGFHLLAKPAGATCNLDCSYCFFLSKEMLYPGSRFRMADELLEAYVRQLIEAHTTPDVCIAWQGGEPTLMGLPFFERSVEYAHRYKKPGQTISFTIQTNGTNVDERWADFFAQHGFLVGISIDGPREVHDAFRVDKGGRPTFDKVVRGLQHLRERGVEYNVLTTLHRANVHHPLEIYRFLRDECGARYLQFIPIVERFRGQAVEWNSWRDRPLYVQEGANVTARSVTPQEFGSFYIAVFDEWVRRDVGSVFVQLFDATLENWYRGTTSLCVHRSTCGTAVAMEHNGDVYSCDHFVEPKYKLGNILDKPLVDLVNSSQQRWFGQSKATSLPSYCRRCDVKFACQGGCPKDRFAVTPEGEPGLNYLCEGYKAFFHHVAAPMSAMAGLLRENRPPAEIMATHSKARPK